MRLMRNLATVFALIVVMGISAQAQTGTQGPSPSGAVPVANPVERADACNQVGHSHSSAATITLTAGGAGSSTGSIYICAIDIMNVEDATGVAAAAATFITTTGINGSPQYAVASGSATAGLQNPPIVINFTAPIKGATSGTNVTFVLPTFATHQTISVNVYYRTGY